MTPLPNICHSVRFSLYALHRNNEDEQGSRCPGTSKVKESKEIIESFTRGILRALKATRV